MAPVPQDIERVARAIGVTRIADLTHLDRVGIPVMGATRPMSRSMPTAQGKGLTRSEARIAAVMESAETFHAETIDRPLLFLSVTEMAARHTFLDPAPFAIDPVDQHDRLLWVEGVRITSENRVWVPLALVSTDWVGDDLPGPRLKQTTAGLGAGFNREQAIRHAVLELVEWRSINTGFQQPNLVALDPTSIADPLIQDLLSRFARAGIGIAIFDMTTAVGLPAFSCVGLDGIQEPEDGQAADTVPCRALVRALLELAQVRATRIAGARDDFQSDSYKAEALREQRQIAERLLSLPKIKSFNPKVFQTGALNHLLAYLEQAGYGPLLGVNLSRADIGIEVWKILSPRLQGPDQ